MGYNAKQVVLRQHAQKGLYANGRMQTENRTLEPVSKQSKGDGRKETARNGQRNWIKDTNSKRSTARKLIPEAQVALTPVPHPRQRRGPAGGAHSSPSPTPYPPLSLSHAQLGRGTAGGQPLSVHSQPPWRRIQNRSEEVKRRGT